MEIVKKTISLEPFRSRMKSSIPFSGMDPDKLYPSLNWGRIPYGVDFDIMLSICGDTAVNAYGVGIRNLGRMTFGELMTMYHAVTNKTLVLDFMTEDDIERYKSVVRFINSKKIVDAEPEPVPNPCCVPCIEPRPDPVYEMDGFEPYYIPSVASVSLCIYQNANIIGSYTFATPEWVPGKRYFEGDKVLYDGKTFKLKEITGPDVIRISGSTINVSGQPEMSANFIRLDNISGFSEYDPSYEGLNEDIFLECVAPSEASIVDLGYIYARVLADSGETPVWMYYVRPSWGGFKNKYDGVTYFDELISERDPSRGFRKTGEYDTLHWEIVDTVVSYGIYEGIGSDSGCVTIAGTAMERNIGSGEVMITGATSETKLQNFIRPTKTVNIYGKELPGRLRTSGSTVMDLKYVIGTIKNVDTSNEKPIGDYLADITLYTFNESGGTEMAFRIQPTGGTAEEHDVIADKLLEEYGISGNKYVTFQGLDTYQDVVEGWASSEEPRGERGVIVFRYFIGADLEDEVDDEGEVLPDAGLVYNGGDKGLVYEDIYEFTAVYTTEVFEDPNNPGELIDRSFVYLELDTSVARADVSYKNLYNYPDMVILSEITANTTSLTEGGDGVSPHFMNADYIMEDYKLGVSFVPNNNENIYIDRGSATAFERHLRLSEIDTLQDMETYANGMFKIKG